MTPRDKKPPASPGSVAARPAIPVRRRLRTLGGIDLWHVEEPKKSGQKWPTIRYEVGPSGGAMKLLEQLSEAWRHFQQLTGAPDKDLRPEPPPIESQLGDASRKPRKTRRRPGRKPS